MKIKNTGDEHKIWQALLESRAIQEEIVEEGTDGQTSDLTEREKFLLAKKAGDKGKGPLADDDEEDKDVKEEGADEGDLTYRKEFLAKNPQYDTPAWKAKQKKKRDAINADDKKKNNVKEEGTKGTKKEREDADTNNNGDIDEDEKTEANKDREEEGKEHLCAKKVKHESFGVGTCIPERHGAPIDGHVNWYAVVFEHDIEVVDTKDLTIIASEMHSHTPSGV